MRLKIAVPMLLLLLLCACGARETSAQTPVRFRTSLTQAGGCDFVAAVTADYGDYIRQFTINCDCEPGKTECTVQEPEYASGITAAVSGEEASVRFGDTVLAVEEFSSRKISPVAAPYISERAWSEGYISATGMDGEMETVEYTLGYGSDQLTVITYFSGQVPVLSAISDGKADLITCKITDFSLKN